MDEKHLKELFAVPIGLELEATVDGQKFYSSEGLRKAFMKSMGAAGRATGIYKQVETLVMKKKLIVPCYLSKNMFRFFKHKMFGNPADKDMLGFYHMKQKRVFILVDNNTNFIGTAKDDELASTTMHECVHLYADRARGKFLKTFMPELERFYISAFSRMFRLKTKPDVKPIIKFLAKYEYNRGYQLNKQLTKYYYLLEKQLKPHSELSDDNFRILLTKLIVAVKLSMVQFDQFIRVYRQNIDIFGPLDRAYKDSFGKVNNVAGVYQELSSISEVICVLTEIYPTHPKIKKIFKDMA